MRIKNRPSHTPKPIREALRKGKRQAKAAKQVFRKKQQLEQIIKAQTGVPSSSL